jgi:DNA invertase Pin-like site-specific DNA recombinase
LDAYIRVSTTRGRSGSSFISPSVQREKIEAWATLRGVSLGEVFEEMDESGARKERPLLLAAMSRVEKGESDGIVVAKLDRFGRSLLDGLANIERIEVAGGTFISVSDGLDIETPTGKLILRIMLSMAEWELDRIRADWATAQSRAIERGVHMGRVPFGYRRGLDKRLEPDPDTAPVAKELFRRRADGVSYVEMSKFLQSAGILTPLGSPYFGPRTVARIVHNRAYLGEVSHGGKVKSNAHPAIIDLATWQEAQAPGRVQGKPSGSYLAGFLRCGSCGLSMYAKRPPKYKRHAETYHCPGLSSAGQCPARATAKAEDLEPLLEEFALRNRSRSPRNSDAEVLKFQKKLTQSIEDLERYRDNSRIHQTLGDDRFADGLGRRQATVDRCALKLAAATRAADRMSGPDTDSLESRWSEMSAEDRRAVLREHIECVFIDCGDAPLIERIHLCPPGCVPADIARRGRPIGRLRPFDARAARDVSVAPIARWSVDRIERELRNFLVRRKTWPSYNDFSCAGRARLHHQMMQSGGPYHWGRRFGLRLDRRAVHWNEDRIKAALIPFLRDRSVWPTDKEFRRAGLGPLRSAVIRHGGIPCWADAFNLEGPRTGRPLWTDEKIERELRDYLVRHRNYPSMKSFFRDDQAALYDAICRTGGHQRWKERFGLSA